MSTNSSLLSLVNFKVDTAGAPRILGFQLLIYLAKTYPAHAGSSITYPLVYIGDSLVLVKHHLKKMMFHQYLYLERHILLQYRLGEWIRI